MLQRCGMLRKTPARNIPGVKLEQVIPASTLPPSPGEAAADVQGIRGARNAVKWDGDTASAQRPALPRCSAFIPSALQSPAFKILKLVHVYFTTGGTNCRREGSLGWGLSFRFCCGCTLRPSGRNFFWSKLQRSRSKGECKGASRYLKQDEQITTRQVTTKTPCF